jgi:ketosteroid isomerase-like protein
MQFAARARLMSVAEAFRHFLAERAVQLPNGELPVQGRQAIYERQQQAGDVQLTWEPVAAEVARSGELGYTWGFYEVRARQPDGTTLTGHGKYTTIWEKQPDGLWKVILDTGNPGPPPPVPTQNRPRPRRRRRRPRPRDLRIRH